MAHSDGVHPLTVGDHYLADMLQELREIKGLLGRFLPQIVTNDDAEPETVNVKEPVKRGKR